MSKDDNEYLGDPDIKRTHSVCLIVSEEIDKCETLLYFLMRYVKKTDAVIGIVHVSALPEYQQWNNVEEQIRAEMRAKAEEEVYALAHRLSEHTDVKPVFYFREGDLANEIVKTINEDSAIVNLFLSGNGKSQRNNELVKYFSGKGLEHLNVPLTIVPEHIDLMTVDELL